MPPQVAPVEVTRTNASDVGVHDLAQVMCQTLPESGMDRMTRERVEETLAIPALTAHL